MKKICSLIVIINFFAHCSTTSWGALSRWNPLKKLNDLKLKEFLPVYPQKKEISQSTNQEASSEQSEEKNQEENFAKKYYLNLLDSHYAPKGLSLIGSYAGWHLSREAQKELTALLNSGIYALTGLPMIGSPDEVALAIIFYYEQKTEKMIGYRFSPVHIFQNVRENLNSKKATFAALYEAKYPDDFLKKAPAEMNIPPAEEEYLGHTHLGGLEGADFECIQEKLAKNDDEDEVPASEKELCVPEIVRLLAERARGNRKYIIIDGKKIILRECVVPQRDLDNIFAVYKPVLKSYSSWKETLIPSAMGLIAGTFTLGFLRILGRIKI